MSEMAKKLPNLSIEKKMQCINCGNLIPYGTGCLIEENHYICDECFAGYMQYIKMREHLIEEGNIGLLTALDEGTAKEYKNIELLGIILEP